MRVYAHNEAGEKDEFVEMSCELRLIYHDFSNQIMGKIAHLTPKTIVQNLTGRDLFYFLGPRKTLLHKDRKALLYRYPRRSKSSKVLRFGISFEEDYFCSYHIDLNRAGTKNFRFLNR